MKEIQNSITKSLDIGSSNNWNCNSSILCSTTFSNNSSLSSSSSNLSTISLQNYTKSSFNSNDTNLLPTKSSSFLKDHSNYHQLSTPIENLKSLSSNYFTIQTPTSTKKSEQSKTFRNKQFYSLERDRRLFNSKVKLMSKIDNVKSFISDAYDRMNQLKENNRSYYSDTIPSARINSGRQLKSNMDINEFKKLHATYISNDRQVTSSLGDIDHHKTNYEVISISPNHNSDNSNHDSSDSGYNRSDVNVEQPIIIYDDHNKSKFENIDLKTSLSTDQQLVRKVENENNLTDKKAERLKKALSFSEERRKLLLDKFTEAQELLQIHVIRTKHAETELKNKFQELENTKTQLEQLKAENNKLLNENKCVNETKKHQEGQISQMKHRTSELESLLGEIRNEMTKLKVECRQKNELIDNLLQSKTFTNMEKSQLEIEHSQLEINLNEYRNENADLKIKVSTLEKEISALQFNCKEATKDYDKMQEILKEREKNWTNIKEKLEEAIKAKESSHNEYLDILHNFNELKQTAETLEIDLKETKCLLNLKTNENDIFKNELKKLEKYNEELKNELSVYQEVKSKEKVEISMLKEQFKKLQNEYEVIKTESAEAETHIKSQITKLNENKVNEFKNQINNLNKEKLELQSKIEKSIAHTEEIKRQSEAKEVIISDLNKKISLEGEKHQKEIQQLIKEKTELLKKIESKEYEFKKIQNRLNESMNFEQTFQVKEEKYRLLQYEFEEKVTQLEDEIEKLTDEKENMKTKCDENERLIQFLETQLKVYNSSNIDLIMNTTAKKSLENSDDTDQLKQKITEQQNIINQLNEKINTFEMSEQTLKNEKDELKQKCRTLEIEVVDLKHSLEDMNTCKTDYEKQLSENTRIMSKFNNLEKELETLKTQHHKTSESLKHSKDKEFTNLKRKVDISESNLKQSLDKIDSLTKDYMQLKDKNKELELYIERDKSNKIQLNNECNELKTKLKKLMNDASEVQASQKRNEEVSVKYKNQITDFLTEIQILRSQLEDSKNVQERQDTLIESLKKEIEFDRKKTEKLKKAEQELNSLKNELNKTENLLNLQLKENELLTNSNRTYKEKILVLEEAIKNLSSVRTDN